MVVSTTVWLLYVGLEPYVRRRWPQVLIGWSRLLSGRFRDPLVGRDVLIGGATAILVGAVDRVSDVILASAGAPPDAPASGGLVTLLGARYLLGSLLDITATWFALFLLFMLFSLRVVLRSEWLAVIALLVIFSVPNLLNTAPGFTPGSMYPLLWQNAGLSYGDLIGKLVDLALERHKERTHA